MPNLTAEPTDQPCDWRGCPNQAYLWHDGHVACYQHWNLWNDAQLNGKAEPKLTVFSVTANATQRFPTKKPRNHPEADFQGQVIDLLHRFQFTVAHFRPGKTGRTYTDKNGNKHDVWVTPVQADGEGFPDIVAIKDCTHAKNILAPSWGVAWELKAPGKAATPDQLEWLRLFDLAGFHTGVYYPAQFDEIVTLLEGWA